MRLRFYCSVKYAGRRQWRRRSTGKPRLAGKHARKSQPNAKQRGNLKCYRLAGRQSAIGDGSFSSGAEGSHGVAFYSAIYCCRRLRIGSTRAACSAGPTAAIIETTLSRRVATTRTCRSRRTTPINESVSSFVAKYDANIPSASPNPISSNANRPTAAAGPGPSRLSRRDIRR